MWEFLFNNIICFMERESSQIDTVDFILSDKPSDPSSSRESGTVSRKYLHSAYHHRHHVILIALLGLSLLLNLVFISFYLCKKFRRSSTLEKLSRKKATLMDNLIQGNLKHSESKQRLVWVAIDLLSDLFNHLPW